MKLARLTARERVAKGAVIEYDDAAYAAYAAEDEPLLTARGNAKDLGGTEPVTPATGTALRFLATTIGARAVVEIGTGCGSSGIWLLRGMRPGGVLTSVDTEPEYHRLARKVLSQAGFAANQARLILGRGLDVLPRLSDGAYDLVFCDTDPAAYPDYLTAGLRVLRAGGVIAFNNVLAPASGPAADGAHDLVEMIGIDERLVPLLLPIAGGLMAAVKIRQLSRTDRGAWGDQGAWGGVQGVVAGQPDQQARRSQPDQRG